MAIAAVTDPFPAASSIEKLAFSRAPLCPELAEGPDISPTWGEIGSFYASLISATSKIRAKPKAAGRSPLLWWGNVRPFR